MKRQQAATAADGSAAEHHAPKRVFLGWNVPFLNAACDHLLAEQPDSGVVHLGNVTLVFPVSRAKGIFSNRLRSVAAERGIEVISPWLTTTGDLPEMLYAPPSLLANEMQQTLAWSHVLRRHDDTVLRPLIPPGISRESIAPWTELGSLLRRLIEEIAIDNVWPEDVVSRLEESSQRERWQLLVHLRDEYLQELQSVGLSDPLESRRLALRMQQCHCDQRFILVGCVDIGMLPLQMLSQATESAEFWIGAPESCQHRFDRWGRVLAREWLESFIEIADETLVSAGSAEEQSGAAAAILQSWADRFESSKITIGITDDAFAPLVETDLALINTPSHWTAGTPLARTAVGTVLSRISEFVHGQTWGNLAALVRHTDVMAAFSSASTLESLRALDQLRADHFPQSLHAELPEKFLQSKEAPAVKALLGGVQQWLAPLLVNELSLADCAEALRQVVHSLYRRPPEEHPETEQPEEHPEQWVDPHREQALEAIERILQAMADIPPELDFVVPPQVAIQMLINRMAGQHLVDDQADTTTTIAGWLELVFDDAEGMVVIGMNHPFVPQAISGDPFLTGSLRTLLEIADNDRRYARDAYILQNLVNSRKASALIVGRYGPDESPTPPSRLLAACPAPKVLERTLKLLDESPSPPKPQTCWDTHREVRMLPIPTPTGDVHLRSISVTAFRDYLVCPFRFYLRHILNMRPCDDASSELAANQFGDLVHAAVEGFGDSDAKLSTDAARIEESLQDHLHAHARKVYGATPAAALRIQIAQAEKRLRHVAHHQALRAREGWTIHSVEDAVYESHGAAIVIDANRRLFLKGRVDRIDYHPEKKKWAILDYKTHGHKPMKKHYDEKKELWLDLQLPLYLFMLEALNIQADTQDVALGYFNVADKERDSGVNLAEFTPELLASAHAQARTIATSILAKNFAPELDASKVLYDDYAMIMQTGIQMESMLSEEPEPANE